MFLSDKCQWSVVVLLQKQFEKITSKNKMAFERTDKEAYKLL